MGRFPAESEEALEREAKVSCIRTIFILFMMNKLPVNFDGISESI